MQRPNNHDVRIFCVVALLTAAAYACRLLGRSGVMPLTMGYFRNLILMGLVFAWGFSVRKRMTQRSVRTYLTLIAALLLFWLAERTCKYLFLFEMPTATRYAWYLFYLPMLLVPLLGIFAAACIGEPDGYVLPKKAYILFLPALAAVGAVLTNDLHQLVFAFSGGILTDGSGKNAYSYGPLYFVVMAWIILELIAFLYLLLHKSRIPGKRKWILLPAGVLLLALLYGCVYVAEIPAVRTFAGDLAAVFSYIMIATFEVCIRTGLIQSNSRYDELFDIATAGAQITDREYRVVLSSETARAFPADTLREAETKPIMLDDGLRLSGRPIRGGHTFWVEDVSDIAAAISELEDINDTLEDSNTAKREENNTLGQKTRLKELNRMYNKMQLETAEQIHKLKEGLAQLAAAEDVQEEKRLLGSIMVLGAYIKRRNNLLCILEKQTTTEASDLDYCLRESVEALQLQGIESGYTMQLAGDLGIKTVMRIYDAFEAVLERTLGRLRGIYATVAAEGGDTVLICEVLSDADMRGFAADGFASEKEDDDLWLLTLRVSGEEGEAR